MKKSKFVNQNDERKEDNDDWPSEFYRGELKGAKKAKKMKKIMEELVKKAKQP